MAEIFPRSNHLLMRMVTPSQLEVQMGPVSSDPRVIRSNPCAGGVWSRTRGQPRACPRKSARAVASLSTWRKTSKTSIRIGVSAGNIPMQREEVEKRWTGNMCQGIQALPRPNKLFGAQQAFGSGVQRLFCRAPTKTTSRHLAFFTTFIKDSRGTVRRGETLHISSDERPCHLIRPSD